MNTFTRRHFLAGSAAVAASQFCPTIAPAIDPIKRPGPTPDIKLSLAAYSFRKALNLEKPTMSLFDFIDFASTLPLDAVELTSYYFAETGDAYLDKLKAHAASKKLAISGVPVRCDFCVKDEAKRKTDIEHVKKWIGIAKRLGAQTVRIFAGKLEKGETLDVAQKRVVSALEELCVVAEKEGILLALENHGGITDTPEHLLALVQPVKSPALGVNVDTGNFHTADVYADVAKIAPYGVCVQVKTVISPANGKKAEADLGRMVKILKDANYHGALVLEYEEAEDPKIVTPKYVKELRSLLG
jgi:sugar phosphate isomerase/epimerase